MLTIIKIIIINKKVSGEFLNSSWEEFENSKKTNSSQKLEDNKTLVSN